jgi:hypothetical protein
MNSGLQGYKAALWGELFPTSRRTVVPSFFYGKAWTEEVVHIFQVSSVLVWYIDGLPLVHVGVDFTVPAFYPTGLADL